MERKMPKLVPLPKEETPAPLVIPKREPKTKPEDKPEIIPEETPALETVEEPAPVEKPDTADARAEALIMAHTAKTATKKKHNAAFLFLGVFIGLAIAVGILFASGAINLDFLKPKPTSDGNSYPNTDIAKSFCETHAGYKYDYLYGDPEATPYLFGDQISDHFTRQYACSIDRTEDNPTEEESSFDYIYMAFDTNYEDNESLKTAISAFAEYLEQDKITKKTDYIKIVSRSEAPFIYLVAYKQGVVEVYADDEDVVKNILKELNFPTE